MVYMRFFGGYTKNFVLPFLYSIMIDIFYELSRLVYPALRAVVYVFVEPVLLRWLLPLFEPMGGWAGLRLEQRKDRLCAMQPQFLYDESDQVIVNKPWWTWVIHESMW